MARASATVSGLILTALPDGSCAGNIPSRPIPVSTFKWILNGFAKDDAACDNSRAAAEVATL